MPAEAIHLTSLREAGASNQLSPAARRLLLRRDEGARVGAVLLDLPYFDRYLAEAFRYALGRPPRASDAGTILHEGAAVRLVYAVVRRARAGRDETLAAVAMGLASHAAIDRALHPLINALARRHAGGRTHDAAHREVEKYQSVLFHERYFGVDRMGTPGLSRVLAIAAAELLADTKTGPELLAAFADAMPNPPSRAELLRMARGYRDHTRLLGSPLGARIVPPADKEAATPRFFRGAWGAFEQVLEAAIARSLGVLEATWMAFDAPDADAPAALAELARRLPEGTIDPAGENVDLGAPYVLARA